MFVTSLNIFNLATAALLSPLEIASSSEAFFIRSLRLDNSSSIELSRSSPSCFFLFFFPPFNALANSRSISSLKAILKYVPSYYNAYIYIYIYMFFLMFTLTRVYWAFFSFFSVFHFIMWRRVLHFSNFTAHFF